jgi:hypothetical protein
MPRFSLIVFTISVPPSGGLVEGSLFGSFRVGVGRSCEQAPAGISFGSFPRFRGVWRRS